MKRELPLLFATLAIPSSPPSIEMDRFELVDVQRAQRNFELRSQKAQVYRQENVVGLEGVEVSLWNPARDRPFSLSGARGVISTTSQNFRTEGKSSIVTPEDLLFETEDVSYVKKDGRLSTPRPVKMLPKDEKSQIRLRVEADGLDVFLRENRYELLKNVRALQGSGPTLVVRSGEATVWASEGLTEFLKNVRVETEGLTMKGERLRVRSGSSDQATSDLKKPSNKSVNGAAFVVQTMDLDMGESATGYIEAQSRGLKIEAAAMQLRMKPDGNGFDEVVAVGGARAWTSDGIEMVADQLSQEWSAGSQKIRLAKGVEIRMSGRVAKCEEAEFDPVTGDLLLRRIASVVREDQKLEGEVIRLSTKNSEIHVERARGVMPSFRGP